MRLVTGREPGMTARNQDFEQCYALVFKQGHGMIRFVFEKDHLTIEKGEETRGG